MEPIGRVQNLGTSYGFSPRVEALYGVNEWLELGVGFQWQFDRRIVPEGSFAFRPIYAAVRLNWLEDNSDLFDIHLMGRLGYALFAPKQDFLDLWEDRGGSLTSTGGGFYASAALGVSLNIRDRPKWGLDLSMETGYAFHQAWGRNSTGYYNLPYQSFMVDIGLDWRL